MKRTIAALALALSLFCVADAGEWPLHGLDRENRRLSPITAISPATVSRLAPKWIWQSGIVGTFQATPIVVDGVMVVSLPFSHVAALDAATGRELWRHVHEKRVEKVCCGPGNRGVAVANGRVFVGTVDARLVALDAKTGKVLWDVEVAPQPATTEKATTAMGHGAVSGSSGVAISAAPLVFEDRSSSASPASATASISIRSAPARRSAPSSGCPATTAASDSSRRSRSRPASASGASTR
jgi:glucose dehydrogenase